MGNYWSTTLNKPAIESKLKDILFELDVYLNKDGYKPYTLRNEEQQKMKDLHFALKELAIHLRKSQPEEIDVNLVKITIEENQSTVEEFPVIAEFPLKQNFDEVVSLFKVALIN